MKTRLKFFSLANLILLIGCTNSTAEKMIEENNKAIRYKNSDVRLNKRYQSFYDISPSMLRKNVKEEQIKWLKSRDKICNTINLNHPEELKNMECFI